jgi:hypothetical protein
MAASRLDGTARNRRDASPRRDRPNTRARIAAVSSISISRRLDRSGLSRQVLAAIDDGSFKTKLEAGFEGDTWLDDNTVGDD